MASARAIPSHVLEIAPARIARRLERRGPRDCWEWTGARDTAGYGKVGIAGGYWRVSRLVLALEGEALGPDLCVCHRCDNPPCCNPAHLFVGTAKENTADRLRKGRRLQRRGEKNPRAKLTPELVREMRQSPLGHRPLARQLGIAPTTVRDARSGRTWGYIL